MFADRDEYRDEWFPSQLPLCSPQCLAPLWMWSPRWTVPPASPTSTGRPAGGPISTASEPGAWRSTSVVARPSPSRVSSRSSCAASPTTSVSPPSTACATSPTAPSRRWKQVKKTAGEIKHFLDHWNVQCTTCYLVNVAFFSFNLIFPA